MKEDTYIFVQLDMKNLLIAIGIFITGITTVQAGYEYPLRSTAPRIQPIQTGSPFGTVLDFHHDDPFGMRHFDDDMCGEGVFFPVL